MRQSLTAERLLKGMKADSCLQVLNCEKKGGATMSNMAKQDKTRQLNVEQLNAIDLLIQGKTDRETAEAVGVSRQTVTDWRNNNPTFIAELNRRREEIWGSQVDKLRSLVAEAVKVLEEDMKNTEDLRLRQSAAVYVLRSVGLYGAELEPEGPTDSKEIEIQKKEKEEDLAFREITALTP
jgi:hypothetical protein